MAKWPTQVRRTATSTRSRRLPLVVACVLSIVLLVAGCGSVRFGGDDNTPPPVSCIRILSGWQSYQLHQYILLSGGWTNAERLAAGTPDVCVLEDMGNTYFQHMYSVHDSLYDYVLYAYLFQQLNTVGALSVWTGSLNPLESIIVNNGIAINPDGSIDLLYTPQYGGYVRQSSPWRYRVSDIAYGHSKPKRFTTAAFEAQPKNYKTRYGVPVPNGKVAKVQGAKMRVTTINTTNNQWHYVNPASGGTSAVSTSGTGKKKVYVPPSSTLASSTAKKKVTSISYSYKPSSSGKKR